MVLPVLAWNQRCMPTFEPPDTLGSQLLSAFALALVFALPLASFPLTLGILSLS